MENPSEEPLQCFPEPRSLVHREVLRLKKATLNSTLNSKQDFDNTAVLSPQSRFHVYQRPVICGRRVIYFF